MKGFTINLNKRKRLRRKNVKIKKLIMYILPVIIISVFSMCVSGLFEKSEKEEFSPYADDIRVFREPDDYSAYYNPVVMNGFFSYKTGDSIEDEMLSSMGVWSIIFTGDRKKYEIFDGELTIPAKEVEERINLLFSEKTEFNNCSSEKIFYDEDNDCYRIPTTGFSPEYVAVLESVTAEKNEIILSVECLRSDSFRQDSLGKTVFPEADKSIIIILEKNKQSFFIREIQEE